LLTLIIEALPISVLISDRFEVEIVQASLVFLLLLGIDDVESLGETLGIPFLAFLTVSSVVRIIKAPFV